MPRHKSGQAWRAIISALSRPSRQKPKVANGPGQLRISGNVMRDVERAISVAYAWSSTEYNANNAWNVHQTGYCNNNNKNNVFAVVPVQDILWRWF